jgi:hypothetical protein
MSRRTLTFSNVEVLPVLGPAWIVLWLRLMSIVGLEFLSRATLSVTGYFARRPDPAIELMLRTAFTDLDRELAEILGDRTPYRNNDLLRGPQRKMPDISRPISWEISGIIGQLQGLAGRGPGPSAEIVDSSAHRDVQNYPLSRPRGTGGPVGLVTPVLQPL